MATILADLLFDAVGYRDEDGNTKAHDRVDGPVELPEGEFHRLADAGAVVKHGARKPEPSAGDPDSIEAEGSVPLVSLTIAKLKDVAAERGIALPGGKLSKADLIALIEAASADGEGEGEPDA